MNKFKFGDKVLCNWENRTFEAIVITQGGESNWIEVIDDDGYKTDVWIEDVELIPHADTKRLEWLIITLSNMDVEDIRYFLKSCMCAEKLEDVDFEKLLKETMGE